MKYQQDRIILNVLISTTSENPPPAFLSNLYQQFLAKYFHLSCDMCVSGTGILMELLVLAGCLVKIEGFFFKVDRMKKNREERKIKYHFFFHGREEWRIPQIISVTPLSRWMSPLPPSACFPRLLHELEMGFSKRPINFYFSPGKLLLILKMESNFPSSSGRNYTVWVAYALSCDAFWGFGIASSHFIFSSGISYMGIV